ncbi:P-loop NTPase fold protein [Flavobacterium sp. S87F.05.LMB.W.Kidney.N]|uniref:KAP family P-loop NTPase fold protein n=1 Tax=Flavobacterium sp. S87F.05.LMB.W.Kidney.N TaxID=1278758 RepID=UPI001064EABF|nr:P-loop NTPase fold protein [Flavobacterium sp. S87F.05.LMB.W.Kidney.N]TDX10322.1 KAP-like P-loop domain-containing protein [Flavobacterium sp. S87F.05.LMB.W.Kidney.N]
MNQIYNSDKPIIEKKYDRFNRFKFSRRISETIIKRSSDEGIVVGLYGLWGEGKSSVLNMIENDLKLADDILVIKFNPWRFKDEDTLILNFFKNLSEKLDFELNNKTEKLGQFFKKYGSVGSVVNLDLSKIGENLSDTQLEDLKKRVNDFLASYDKKIVVIIDDIDRLDKQELFSLFKLIKLTGDFTKTYYILSFDDEMVASSIGERFAKGDNNSGHNFLEKVIQVPLRIPQALPKDLLQYTFDLLNYILNEYKIDLGREEEQNVGSLISQFLLLRIKTPRLAIRYVNSLSFLIPLLDGEVNMSDLILFEGVKILYPKYYDFIKSSPEYFIETYYDFTYEKKNLEKIEELKSNFEELKKDLSKNEQNAILKLLKHLFPFIKEGLENYSLRNRDDLWIREKRIASSKYFYKYFIYSVSKDDISDVYFENYIKNLSTKEYDQILHETEEIFSSIDPVEYLNKISFYEDSLEWETKKVLIELVCSIQGKFEGMKGGTFSLGYNPKSQAAVLVNRLLLSHKNYSERFNVAKKTISSEVPFEFSKELLKWFKVGKSDEEKTLKIDEIKFLNKVILDRALDDSKKCNSNLFEKYEHSIFLLLSLFHESDPIGLTVYIKNLLDENPKFIKTIIYSLTSMIYSSTRIDPYKNDFARDTFQSLKRYYDINILHKLLMENFEEEIVKEEVFFFDNDEGQTILNALRQFNHWYNLDVSENLINQ